MLLCPVLVCDRGVFLGEGVLAGSCGWLGSVVSVLFTVAACEPLLIPWEEQSLPSFVEICKLMVFEPKVRLRIRHQCLLLTSHYTWA